MKAPAAGVARIGSGNFYVGNKTPAKAVGVAAGLRCHSFSGNESVNVVDDWRKRTGFKTYAAPGGFRDMRDAWDCVTIKRDLRNMPLRHVSFTQVCEDADPKKLAHDRVFTMVAYEAPMLGKVGSDVAILCHINIHPNPINHLSPSSRGPMVREFVRSMNRLDGMLAFAKSQYYVPVVSGDFNLSRTKAPDRKYLDMYDLFRKYKMQVRTEGIDGMAWDSRLRLVDWTVIPKGARTGADHPWLVADFKRK